MSEDGTDRSGEEWIGCGTWLVDRRHCGPTIGVITGVAERERGMASRLSIQWRPRRYQNISLSMALDNLKRGIWEVDHAE